MTDRDLRKIHSTSTAKPGKIYYNNKGEAYRGTDNKRLRRYSFKDKDIDEKLVESLDDSNIFNSLINQTVSNTTNTTVGLAETYETVSKNLKAYDFTISYIGNDISSILYAVGILKTFNYTGDNLTSIVLSGTTPSSINLIKTLGYDGSNNLISVTYS